jgi:geranylgeranyl pyrophosphate synthase
MLEAALNQAIAASAFGDLAKVMQYAVLPAGKLFRPRLVEALALDLTGNFSNSHLQLALAIELHHAYTLVHDDLPAMDNDLVRRGKPATHVQFGQWQAILAGDALLISSFQELAKINHSKMREVHRLFAWATGGRGLVLGQFQDLQAQGQLDLQQTLRVHELKTGRLIQAATLGSLLLGREEVSLGQIKHFLRLGRDIGVAFQLLDDFQELNEQISGHEREINPFITTPKEARLELKKSIQRLQSITADYSLDRTADMLVGYFDKLPPL